MLCEHLWITDFRILLKCQHKTMFLKLLLLSSSLLLLLLLLFLILESRGEYNGGVGWLVLVDGVY